MSAQDMHDRSTSCRAPIAGVFTALGSTTTYHPPSRCRTVGSPPRPECFLHVLWQARFRGGKTCAVGVVAPLLPRHAAQVYDVEHPVGLVLPLHVATVAVVRDVHY